MKILLQILIFAIFIISNGYQSFVTSFMLDSVRQPLLKTIDDLLDSDLKILYSWSFEYMQENNPKFQKMMAENRFSSPDINDWHKDAVAMNLAYWDRCEDVKNQIDLLGDGKSYLGQYLINEYIDSIPVDLYTRPFHPYLAEFQQIMDRTFEAGLPVAWNRWYYGKVLGYGENRQKNEAKKEMLDFETIAPFCLILAIGYISAFIALSFEIFYHDFVSELSKEYFKKKFKSLFDRELKTKRTNEKKKVRVKIIQVQPTREI